jgi:putative tricarboxylic transport membrane protein
MLENLWMGFEITFQWANVLAIVIGVLVGIAVGAMPGMNAATGIAVLLPFTYALPSETSLILLCALYTACEYGGSITAIAISTPGTPSAVATVFDGYQLTLKGLPCKALGISLYSSVAAGFFTTFALILLAVPLADIALRFGPPEYFALGIFGLAVISSLTGKSVIKGFITAVAGLMITIVGIDPFTSFPRFSFGIVELFEGIGLIPSIIGLLAAAEVFVMLEELTPAGAVTRKISGALPTWQEFKTTVGATVRGSIIGLIIGIIPGAGGAIACMIAYNEERRWSKEPSKFGTGCLEGVAAPEAANNAVVSGALVPMLTLGVPGSAAVAVLMGALMLHNLVPGPELFSKHPGVVYSLFASLFVSNLIVLAVGLMGTRLWLQVIKTPKSILAPMILLVASVGCYAVNNSLFQVWTMLIFGLVGYLMRKLDFPVVPMVLAMVLGFMIETNLRRALLIGEGSWLIFLTRPLSLIFLILGAVSFLYPFWQARAAKKGAVAGDSTSTTSLEE